MADGYTEPERPRRRRGRGLLAALLVLLVLLAVGLVVADRFGAAYAERRIADQVESELASQGISSSRPEVTVHGLPFLTQVADGTYRRVDVLLRDLITESASALPADVQVRRLDVTARNVSAPLRTLRTGEGDIVADTVEGTAVVDYAGVARLIGQEGVQLGERDGRLAVTAPLQFLGMSLTVQGTADLVVEGQTLRVRFRELTAENLPDTPGAAAVVNAFAEQLGLDLNLGTLPFDLTVQEVRPLPEGLSFSATAAEVPLNRAAG